MDFTIDLKIPISSALTADRRVHPVHVNRISSMGHPCQTFLYHCRVNWDSRIAPDASLLGIFRQGNLLEPHLVSYFNLEVGPRHDPPMRIIGQQATTHDSLLVKYQIEGSSDGFLQYYNGEIWITFAVVDIKTAGPNPYRGYYDLESLKKHTWSQRYIAQLMLYSFAHNLEHCVIFFVNKTNVFHDWKSIQFDVDFEYVETLLQTASLVNMAIADFQPEALDKVNRPDLCNDCGFKHICMPDLEIGQETKVCLDGEVERALVRYIAAKEVKGVFAEAEKTLFSMLVKGQNIVIGTNLITWKKVEPRGKKPYYRMKIN